MENSPMGDSRMEDSSRRDQMEWLLWVNILKEHHQSIDRDMSLFRCKDLDFRVQTILSPRQLSTTQTPPLLQELLSHLSLILFLVMYPEPRSKRPKLPKTLNQLPLKSTTRNQ
jgi:hypothetical protein